jgi:signal transduction histidine kinase
LLDFLPQQIIWIHSGTGGLDYLNQVGRDYWGELVRDFIDWENADLIHPLQREEFQQKWKECLGEKVFFEMEYQLKHHDGSYRWHRGRISSQFGSSIDIEDYKMATCQRDELISTCAHELKNSITGLKLQVQVLSRQGEASKSQEPQSVRLVKFLQTCDRQLERLVVLINDMSDFALIGAGKFQIKLQEIDMVPIVADLVERMKSWGRDAPLPIELVSPPTLYGKVDPLRIEQVLMNLLNNAWKYGEGKPIQVILAQEDLWFSITVSDQGGGINLADQQRIFEAYERGSQAASSPIIGLGMGLYITRAIVKALGGSIQVHCQVQGGTQFVVKIPFAVKSWDF